MKKTTMFGIFAVLVLITMLQGVSAYHDYYGTEFVADFRDGFYARDYRYVDYYGYPSYRVYRYPYDNYKELKWKFEKRRAIAWVLNSYDERYRVADGRESKDVFCKNCVTDGRASSFGNKPSYDYRFDNTNDNNFYYDAEFDPQLGYYNWRF